MVDAGRPGGVICGVVLRPERLQPELPSSKPARDREIGRDERLITHQAMLARLAGHNRTATTELVYRQELRPVIATGGGT
jgi:hypothetical protein